MTDQATVLDYPDYAPEHRAAAAYVAALLRAAALHLKRVGADTPLEGMALELFVRHDALVAIGGVRISPDVDADIRASLPR